MTYTLTINQLKTIEWGLSLNEAVTMCIFADLESWATKFRSDEPNDGDFYYVLYLSKIVKEAPILGSRQTVGRAVARLESLGLIKSINKHSTPAYALTAKGLSWKKVMPENIGDEKPNDGESTDDKPQHASKPKRETKKHKFLLSSKTSAENLSKEYLSNLYEAAVQMAQTKGISNPREEFEKFMEHHSKNGNKWVNWLSAFSTWCRNHVKFNAKPNDGESDNGLYQ